MAKTNAERLAEYEACETAILEGGQSYRVMGREYTRANLSEIRAEIAKLQRAIAAESGNSGRFIGTLRHDV